MQYRSLYIFYWFGTCLRYLQDADENRQLHGDGNTIFNVERLFTLMEELQLTVTVRHGHQLLDGLLEELKQKPPESTLTLEAAGRLGHAIRELRGTLDSEILGLGAYTPTPKRLDLSHLLSDVSNLFAPGVFNSLPPIAQFDFAEAGKCIAFERPTAAAFHILRATEDVLRFYYTRMIKRGRISTLTWGPVVADLRKHNLTKANESLNNHLDNIRTSFRNPTQHPEATYDIHEAQDLWAICVEVVNRMIKILQDAKRL